RAEHHWRTNDARTGGALAEQRVVREFAQQQSGRVAKVAVRGSGGLDEADVGQPTRHLGHADVAVSAYMHLAQRPGSAMGSDPTSTICCGPGSDPNYPRREVLEVRADRPAPGAPWMPRQTQPPHDRGPPAVRRDHDGG